MGLKSPNVRAYTRDGIRRADTGALCEFDSGTVSDPACGTGGFLLARYNPKNRHNRKESERFKSFTYEELTKRDKVNLDIFWLKDEALEESANLPAPGIIAADIVDDLEAALAQFAEIAADLKG
jgi:hypothetical protein